MSMVSLAAKFLIPGAVIAFLYLVELYDKDWVSDYILSQTWFIRSVLAILIIIGSIVVGVDATLFILSIGVLFSLILPNR